MRKFPVYRYTRPDGGVSISPVKPDAEYSELTRLIAEEGRTLTDGVTEASCVDTDNPDVWEEVLTDSEALSIILGGEPGA